MDRINVSFAALRMNQDLGFSATVYGLGAGLFFLAYALFEVPSNIFLTRFGARRWLARIMITWGLIAAGTMFVTSARQFYVMRFLLGTAEAGFFPGVVYYVAHWFPRAHRGRAISRFYLCGPLSVVVMGSLSGWLLGLDGTAGFHGWQWLFLVQGLPATLIGLLILFRLPSAPAEVGWLKPDERAWLERELAADAARLGEPAEHGMFAALSHPLVMQLGLIGFLTIGAIVAFTLSAPLLLEHATSLHATGIGWLAAIGGVLGAIGMLFSGAFSDRRGERFTTLLVSTALMGLAFLTLAIATTPSIVMAAYLLFGATWGAVTLSQVMIWPDVLHIRLLAVGCAAINTMSQIGAFVMPYGWGASRDATGSFHAGLCKGACSSRCKKL